MTTATSETPAARSSTDKSIAPVLAQIRFYELAVLFWGGVNLILIQWVVVREMATVLLGTELVILLVSVTYFIGLSIGYLVSSRIRREWLIPFGCATLIFHLTLPAWFRLIVAGLSAIDAYGIAYVVLPPLTALIVPVFYSIFLPLLIDRGTSPAARRERLPLYYAVELVGSAAGVLCLVAAGSLGLSAVHIIYSIGLLFILTCLGMSAGRVAMLTGVSIVLVAILPTLNTLSNNLFFQVVQGLPSGTRTLFSGYSAYQKVDVLEAPDGSRYLYLDGLEHFGDSDGSWLNIILGRIPADILRPREALVIGAGSMEMEAMIAEYAGQVTTVEIDAMVVDVSLEYFDGVNRMSVLDNRQIVVDDAKHYIANTDVWFDLVATDTPAAFTIQTATLYSVPFYQAIENRLTADGVLAANLTSTFDAQDQVSRRIAASLLEVFDQVMIVTSASAGWSFAYASDNLPFGPEVVEARLDFYSETAYAIYTTEAVRALVGDAEPITLDTMDIVLQTSLERVLSRLN